jgi:hypothetical protein
MAPARIGGHALKRPTSTGSSNPPHNVARNPAKHETHTRSIHGPNRDMRLENGCVVTGQHRKTVLSKAKAAGPLTPSGVPE